MNYYNAEAYIVGGGFSFLIIGFVFAANSDSFISLGIGGLFCVAVCFAIPFMFIIPSIFLILKRRKIKKLGKVYNGKIICFYKPNFLFSNGPLECYYTVAYEKGGKSQLAYFRDSNYDRRLADLSCKVYVLDKEEYVCGFKYKKVGEKGMRIPKE